MTAVARPTAAAVATREDATPGTITQLLTLAVEKGLSPESLERLFALHERVTAQQAAREFAEAMADFQRVCPRIQKTGVVDYQAASGRVKFNYSELDEISKVINPLLHERGLSYTWNSNVEGAIVKCDCILRHTNGHSVTASFACPTTSKAGMSDQQRYGAAVKYSMRWSLIQVLGLVTTDDDQDAAQVDPTPIDEAQRTAIEDLLEAAKGRSKKPDGVAPRFLTYMGVAKVAEIRAADFGKATEALRAKEAK